MVIWHVFSGFVAMHSQLFQLCRCPAFICIYALFQLTLSPQAAANDCMKHAAHTLCSHCKKGCATIKCCHVNEVSGEGCNARYHLTCAMSDRALLHQEWFLLLCPRHRPDSVARITKGSETIICHTGPTAELIARLENGDSTVGIPRHLPL